MKVLFFSPYLAQAGTERHIFTLAQGLRERAEIGLLAPEGPMASQFVAAGVRYYPLPPLSARYWRQAVEMARRALAELKPDLAHVHAGVELLWLLRQAGGGALPTVFTVHSFFGPGAGLSYWLAARLGQRWAQRVIAVSEKDGENLRRAGLRAEQLRVIHNGVAPPRRRGPEERRADREALGLPPEAVVIGAVGRLAPQKGFDLLVRAFAALGEHLWLLLIGGGPQEAELRRLAQALGVSERVVFAGHRMEATRWLQCSDIFALPSRMEGFSLALLEAAALAFPIVATRVGGNPEFIRDGENGLLVPPAEAGALAQALGRLVAAPAWAKQLGERARVSYEARFTERIMVEKTWQVYAEVERVSAGN